MIIPFRRSTAQIEREYRQKAHERYLARQPRVHFKQGFESLCGVPLSSFVIGRNSPAFPDGITCKNCLRKMKYTSD